MLKKSLAGTLAAATVLFVAGCPMINNLIPAIPVDLPEKTVTLKEIWPSAPSGTAPVAVTAQPSGTPGYFKIPNDDLGQKVDVPAEAKGKVDKIESATLNFDATNESGVPIRLRVFLAKSAPFAATPIGDITLASTGASTGSATINTALLSETELRLGIGVSTPGTDGKEVAVKSDGKITIKPKLLIKLKLF